jgi:hypothetical protein
MLLIPDLHAHLREENDMLVECRRLTEEHFGNDRLILRGDRFEKTDPRATHRGRFKLDPSITPKTIHLLLPRELPPDLG